MVGQHPQQLAHRSSIVSIVIMAMRLDHAIAHTGGSSSFSASLPRSGLAIKFAKTPSDWTPPPYTLVDLVADPAAADGRIVCVVAVGCDVAEDASVCAALLVPDDVLLRTKRCLSSASSSLSSDSSNASARSGLTVWFLSLDMIDDALEWKEGGGELGIGCVGLGWEAIGDTASSSSWAFTC